MNQVDTVLRHLEEKGSITALEAMWEYGIYRLASRISDLKSAGVAIEKEMIKGTNRDGEPIRYARYMLKKEA